MNVLAGFAIMVSLVGAFIYADRAESFHYERMRNGKIYLRQEKYLPSIADLITNLEDDQELGEILEEKGELAEEDGDNPRDEVARYANEIANEFVVTSDVRALTKKLGNQADAIESLEDDLYSLPRHIRTITGTLFIATVIFLVNQYISTGNSPSFEWVLFFSLAMVLAAIAVIHQLIMIVRKNRNLRNMARKYERLEDQ